MRVVVGCRRYRCANAVHQVLSFGFRLVLSSRLT